jgi:hypothetical protein
MGAICLVSMSMKGLSESGKHPIARNLHSDFAAAFCFDCLVVVLRESLDISI